MADTDERTGPSGQQDRTGERALPPQATMGLLGYLTAHSLDEDYAHVAAQRAARDQARAETAGDAGPAPDPGRSRRVPVLALGVLAAFGLLVATAAVTTSRGAGVQESSRASLISQVQERRGQLDDVRAQVRALQADLDRIQQAYLNASATGRSLSQQLTDLQIATGFAAAQGPGVRIVVDDNPRAVTDRQVVFDKDLQKLVNGLWAAGAEAVAINGQRVTALTAIRTAGDAITVNFKSLTRPYVVRAIGDPDQLPARFIESEGGTWWLNLRSVYQLQFTMTSEDPITVPAAATVTLQHATTPNRQGSGGSGQGAAR